MNVFRAKVGVPPGGHGFFITGRFACHGIGGCFLMTDISGYKIIIDAIIGSDDD